MSAEGSRPSEAIRRERILRDSDAIVAARRRRQSAVAAVRAAKQMAKAAAAIERRVEAGDPPPQRAVSEVLNFFRREYDALTEHEQVRFEVVVQRYVAGRVSVDEWVRVVRSLRASYRATLSPEPPRGGRMLKAKDCCPPAGW
jgi:hypothetical protein